jgi:hypothetical protein
MEPISHEEILYRNVNEQKRIHLLICQYIMSDDGVQLTEHFFVLADCSGVKCRDGTSADLGHQVFCLHGETLEDERLCTVS